MANKKLTDLDAITSIPEDALIYVVIDPESTAVSKKITWLNTTESIFIVTDLEVVSEVTEFPASAKNRWYRIVDEGWLGGEEGDGLYVNVGDLLYCSEATEAGTKAVVWASWNIYRHEISMPDGYRGVDMDINSAGVTQSYGFFFKADGMYITLDGTPYKLAVVE